MDIAKNLHQKCTLEYDIYSDESNERRKQFRRIVVTKGEKNRTAIEQISELRLGDDLALLTPLAIQ
jgi:hypothetical protein